MGFSKIEEAAHSPERRLSPGFRRAESKKTEKSSRRLLKSVAAFL